MSADATPVRVVGAGRCSFPLLDNLAAAEVDVAVAPEHRRSGFGTAVLDHLERRCREERSAGSRRCRPRWGAGPTTSSLSTRSGEESSHMVAVNDRLGFVPVARLGELQRRPTTLA